MRNIQELWEDYDIVDNNTDLEHGPVYDNEDVEKKINKNIATVIC